MVSIIVIYLVCAKKERENNLVLHPRILPNPKQKDIT